MSVFKRQPVNTLAWAKGPPSVCDGKVYWGTLLGLQYKWDMKKQACTHTAKYKELSLLTFKTVLQTVLINGLPMKMTRIPSLLATVLPFSSEVNPEAASTFSRILLSFITLVAQTYPCLQDRSGKQLVKLPQWPLVFASHLFKSHYKWH